MDRYTAAWLHSKVHNFYATHRHSADELYESEKKFLPAVLKKNMRVLDIGCAAGGFSNIMKSFEPSIRYFGMDISHALLTTAKARYRGDVFIRADAAIQPFKDNAFDMVYSSGLCHVIERYESLIKEAYRVSRKYLLFDVRLTEEDTLNDPARSFLKIAFDGNYDGTHTPYIILNGAEFVSFLKTITPTPVGIKAWGYIHPVSHMAESLLKEVCMAFFLVEKGACSSREMLMDIDLPISI